MLKWRLWFGLSILWVLVVSVPGQAQSPEVGTFRPVQPTGAVQLEIQALGTPQGVLLRQLHPFRYPKYEAKARPLSQSLHAAYGYLGSLDTQPISLQRLSAFSAEAWLDWSMLSRRVTLEETQFQSYQLMHEAVIELRSLSDYWRATEQVRRVSRGTQDEYDLDQALMRAKREKIGALLRQLETQDKLKQNLRDNFTR